MSGASPTPARPSRLAYWIAAAAFIVLAVRQVRFVNAYAVNMMFGDQWDIYRPMFLGEGWWRTFDLQHGPHREGAGLWLTRFLADMSGWNSRWDAFAAIALMIAAALLAFRLALRFGLSSRPLLLAAVPLLFLNVHQYETFVGPVNLSHGVMPMALFMAYCLCWFQPAHGWRLAMVSLLTVLLIFTGFGLFVGLITPVLVAVEAVQAWRERDRAHALKAAAAATAVVAGWAAFAVGYTFEPAVPGFRFPYEHPAGYLLFVGKMLGNFFGAPVLSRTGLAIGLAAGTGLLAISAWNGLRCLVNGVVRDPCRVVLFCLSTFTLLYCANCAIGRVFTSDIAPLAPRYVTLMVPGGLAILLQLSRLGARRALAYLAVIYSVLLIPATAFPRPEEIVGAKWYADGRRSWRAAYLETRDEGEANRRSGFSVYPGPLGDRLPYLKARGLNLFLPGD